MFCKMLYAVLLLNVLGETIASEVQVRQARSIDVFGNTRSIISGLLQDMKLFSEKNNETLNALHNIIIEQTNSFNAKFAEDIQLLKALIKKSVANAMGESQGAAAKIYECSQKNLDKAEQLIIETNTKVTTCVEKTILDITDSLTQLNNVNVEAINAVEDVEKQLEQCGTINFANMFKYTFCLSKALLDVQPTSTKIIAKGGMLNVMLSSQAAALSGNLQMCAVKFLTDAGVSAAIIISDVKLCVVNIIASREQLA